MEDIIRLQKIIDGAQRMVFFGGAGVSTESGIPDFRSQDGLYKLKYSYPPEQILSHTFFNYHTREFFDFYRDKMLYLNAKPNAAHYALAQWEKQGKLTAVITQNIDGLHQKAGSSNVLELHGSVWRNYCTHCGKFFHVESIANTSGVPHCDCGGIVKPDVVLYEEGLDRDILDRSVRHIEEADVMIIGGTSLNVYPAAGLVDYFHGKNLVVINKGKPAKLVSGALYIDGKIGEVFSQLH